MTAAACVSVIGALLTLATGQSAPEPPAALRRPNLQVLTQVPESQLFLMMNAISDSLGVRCDYCHVRESPDPAKTWSLAGGWKWDREDKPTKKIARDMIRMVLDVNERYAGGRMTVTCYTCHRGASAPERFPPLPPRDYSTISEVASRPLPSVDDLWNAYTRGVFGAGLPRRFSTTAMSATDDRSEGRHGGIDVVFKQEDRVRMTFRMPPDPVVSQAVNGDTGWLATSTGVRPLRTDEVARARKSALRFGAIKIERPANLRVTGIERNGGRDVYVAAVDVDARTRTMLFFDVATGLLARERTITETTLVPLQEQIDYEDYRSVDGVMLPFVMRSSDGAPFDTSVRTFTSIRHDVNVDDATFERPGVPAPKEQPPPAIRLEPAPLLELQGWRPAGSRR
jgi:Photosynthetic reaction centre cytochrome C subunit